MADDIIHIPFEKSNGKYTLQDALNLTQAEIDALGDDGIAAMKQQRFDNWLAVVEAPPPEDPPSDLEV